ncbi:hypothetical protein KBZ21_41320, partial [Streptomyces sp. A73]|nr:hypothetical protein [Streptomyces sp. A73]
YGREYIAVGSGDCGTDDCPPLITAESPLDMTLFWDARARVATTVSDDGEGVARWRRAQRGLTRLLSRDVRRLRRLILPQRL